MISEYQAMQQSGATAFTFQAAGPATDVPQIVVAAAPFTTPTTEVVETVHSVETSENTVQIPATGGPIGYG